MLGNMRRLRIPDGVLAVEDEGVGEPVVLVQTALTADELLPVAEVLRRRGGTRTVRYHRRGYGSGGPARRPASVQSDADDCRLLLDTLGINRAHVVGLSYAAACALELAATAPGRVRTLVLIEPPPRARAGSRGVRRGEPVVARGAAHRRCRAGARGVRAAALRVWLARAVGGLVPGCVAQMVSDAATFFDGDVPALLAWDFSRWSDVTCPVLHIGGTASGGWFRRVRDVVMEQLPQAEDVEEGR